MNSEHIIMELIVNGGDARSRALEAIAAAGRQDFKQAEADLLKCTEALNKAHAVQTTLIQGELNGEQTEINLLQVHAQDHLMNAMTVRDLATQMVEMYKVMYDRK